MYIARIKIQNFRGIKEGQLLFNGHTVLVGDNNSGKSTILEAIDLVLGPDRLSRRPVVDEHDFYAGEYKTADGTPIEIQIEVLIVGLTDEQKRHFVEHLEFWDSANQNLISSPPPENTDKFSVLEAIRVGFSGSYDVEEDDFEGKTYFLSPKTDEGVTNKFTTRDKRVCGFLFLRTLRTGSRALSLEHGSLLDIILKLQEKRLQMWEDVLIQLKTVEVAEKKELGIQDTLKQIQEK
jgi:putative ATP-dependent endonuclease of OLD family